MTAVSAPARSAVSEVPPHHPPTRLGPLYRLWDGLGTLLANALLWAILAAYLLPMVYMFVTSIKEDAQLQSAMAPLWPARTVKYEYEGETYWFCGKGCMLEFQDDPEKYLDPSYEKSM